MLTRQERFEFHRLLEQSSERQLNQERATLEYALDHLERDSEDYKDVWWMYRQTLEEISARAEVAEIRRRRAER